ncbi:MAG TPA: GldG family protein [Rectinemataceae bacterium]|nr:GldG family protein [Rectinemataceae bacterium]
MNSRTGKRRLTILLVLTAAVVIAALLVAGRFAFRVDLSSDHSQSLSKVTKELWKQIPEHLHITYYISPTLSARHPGPKSVEDLLREFEASSHGRVDVSVEDPTAKAGIVEGLGVQGRQMQIVDQSEQRVAVVYSGVVVQYLDRTEVLPFVLDTSTLEYDLVKAVLKVVRNDTQKIEVLVGDADKSLPNDYKTLNDELSKSGWQVAELNRGDAVPPDTKVLLVLGNNDLDDYDVYRIDEYLERGGSVFVGVKGVNVNASQNLTAGPLAKTALLNALSIWGVAVQRSLLLDPSALTVPFQQMSPNGAQVIQYTPYPHFVVTRPENASRNNPVTARLAGLDLFWPSPLTLKPIEGIKEESLVKSSPKAWLQTANFAVSPDQSASFDAEADKTSGQYLLAASLQGVFPSAFAGAVPPQRLGAAILKPEQGPPQAGKLFVVGSSDFATDLMNMTNSPFNASFVASAADWLASGNELASIRSRGARDLRLTKVQDPGARNSLIVLAYAINLVIVPALVALVAVSRRRRRRLLARMDGESTLKTEVVGGEEGDAAMGRKN